MRLKVVAKATRDLVVGGGAGADLPRRADLIVSEIFGDDPLAEGASAYMLLGYHPPHTHTRAARYGVHLRHSLVITPSLPLGALGTLRHARRALLAPLTGLMVPRALKLLCALASVPAADMQASVRGQASGVKRG